MIQSVTYRARLDGKNGEDVLAASERLLNDLTRAHFQLLGAHGYVEGSTFKLVLRLEESDTWRVTARGRKMATFVFRTLRLSFTPPLFPELLVTEPTRNKLRVGEGRTPMSRPRRVRPLPD